MFLSQQTKALIDTYPELVEAHLKKWIENELNSSKDIEVRKLKLKQAIQPHVISYGREMCNEFYLYWTEPSQNQKKMRFELEKTWEVSRRLARWKKNNSDKVPNGKGTVAEGVHIPRKMGTNNQEILDQLYNKPN